MNNGLNLIRAILPETPIKKKKITQFNLHDSRDFIRSHKKLTKINISEDIQPNCDRAETSASALLHYPLNSNLASRSFSFVHLKKPNIWIGELKEEALRDNLRSAGFAPETTA